MSKSYDSLKPFWEAWKYNTKRPSDPDEAANWDGKGTLLTALANGDPSVTADLSDAYEYLLQSKPLWTRALCSLPNYDSSTNMVTLFRGVTNEKAISVRCSIANGEQVLEDACLLICYSANSEVALGEAGKGRARGVCYKVSVPLESVVFFDHEQQSVEGNLSAEQEVICFHRNAFEIKMADIISISVQYRKPLAKNRTDLTMIKKRIRELEELESKLNPGGA